MPPTPTPPPVTDHPGNPDQQTVGLHWSPHTAQREVMSDDHRFRVLAAGRRFGKTQLSAVEALRHCLSRTNATVWWVAPSFEMSKRGVEAVKALVDQGEGIEAAIRDTKESPPRSYSFITGSELSFRSADRPDALRGAGLDFLVVDESASVSREAWAESLRPSLADTEGDALVIGSPRRRGSWFHELFERGQGDAPEHADTASWRFPSSANPHLHAAEIEANRNQLPADVFAREFEAEFTAQGAQSVFGDFSHAVGDDSDYPSWPVPPGDIDRRGPEDVTGIGVDLGRSGTGQTAIVVLAPAPDGRMLDVTRLRDVSWGRIRDAIETTATDYAPCSVALDASRDNAIIEDVAGRVEGRVIPVKFTASEKETLVRNLRTRIETGDITLPPEDVSADGQALHSEFRSFEYEVRPSGTVRYEGKPSDDCVDAAALAVRAQRAQRAGPKSRTERISVVTGGAGGS